MPNLLPIYYASQDNEFRGRVAAAAVGTALAVLGEEGTAGQSPDALSARSQLAQRVLANPLAAVEPLSWAVAANSTVSAAAAEGGASSVSDSDIEYVLTQVWDDVSGASSV